MTPLKIISKEAVPRALELVERYRLLNEPEQAASICHDILSADPGNADATRMLLLAMTDQFFGHHGADLASAERLAKGMASAYDQAYYGGIAYERWARSRLHHGSHKSMASGWLHRAMECYEKAEGLREPGNDAALLRWNACARLLETLPGEREEVPALGD